jgi:hypothetical protein
MATYGEFPCLRIFYDYCLEGKSDGSDGCDTETSCITCVLDPRQVVMHEILILNWLNGLASV